MKNIIITNPEELKKTKKAIAKDGANQLHILSDFDRTLTNAFVNGKACPALIFLLNKNYLAPEYHQKYQALFEKYYPIEVNPKIPPEEKKNFMAEWWQKVFNLLIESRLNKKDLQKMVELQNIKFRGGFDQFTHLLRDKKIPLIIMSSTGLGGDAISMYLEKEKKLYQNIHIIANALEWDENGYAIAAKEPIIHVANKDETVIKNFPVFYLIEQRKNVILLGDAIEDVGMAKGFNYDNLIKIGFLNEGVAENLKTYKKYYDVIILNDSGLEYVNQLLKEICQVVIPPWRDDSALGFVFHAWIYIIQSI